MCVLIVQQQLCKDSQRKGETGRKQACETKEGGPDRKGRTGKRREPGGADREQVTLTRK